MSRIFDHNVDNKIILERRLKKGMLLSTSNKGSGAYSTVNRRLTWELLVWPMLLDLARPYFTLDEFQNRRKEISLKYQIKSANLRGGLVSLTYKGFLFKTSDNYYINLKLVPYLKSKVELDYSKAFRKMVAKQ